MPAARGSCPCDLTEPAARDSQEFCACRFPCPKNLSVVSPPHSVLVAASFLAFFRLWPFIVAMVSSWSCAPAGNYDSDGRSPPELAERVFTPPSFFPFLRFLLFFAMVFSLAWNSAVAAFADRCEASMPAAKQPAERRFATSAG